MRIIDLCHGMGVCELVEHGHGSVMGRCCIPLPLAGLPQQPVELHARLEYGRHARPDALDSCHRAGPELDFISTARRQELLPPDLQYVTSRAYTSHACGSTSICSCHSGHEPCR